MDQRRALAPPRALDRRTHGVTDGQDVIAIDGDTGHPVGRGVHRDVGHHSHRRDGVAGAVLIVLADEDQRQLPQR